MNSDLLPIVWGMIGQSRPENGGGKNVDVTTQSWVEWITAYRKAGLHANAKLHPGNFKDIKPGQNSNILCMNKIIMSPIPLPLEGIMFWWYVFWVKEERHWFHLGPLRDLNTINHLRISEQTSFMCVPDKILIMSVENGINEKSDQ